MTAINQDVVVNAGNYVELEVLIATSKGDNVNPENITAKYKAGNGIEKNSDDGGILITAENDTALLTIILQSEDTNNQTFQRFSYRHEVEIRDAEGRPFTVLKGSLKILPVLIPAIPIIPET